METDCPGTACISPQLQKRERIWTAKEWGLRKQLTQSSLFPISQPAPLPQPIQECHVALATRARDSSEMGAANIPGIGNIPVLQPRRQ